MKSTCMLLLLAAQADAAAPAKPADPPVAAAAVAARGKPRLRRAGETAWKLLRKSAQIRAGDSIETRGGGCVRLALVSGVELTVLENSTVELRSGGGKEPALIVTRLAAISTRMINPRARMDVQTPHGVAALRGGEASLEVEGRLAVKVLEGAAEVRNERGVVALGAGQWTEVSGPDAPPKPPQPLDEVAAPMDDCEPAPPKPAGSRGKSP